MVNSRNNRNNVSSSDFSNFFETHLYKITIDESQSQKITNADNETYTLTPDKEYFIKDLIYENDNKYKNVNQIIDDIKKRFGDIDLNHRMSGHSTWNYFYLLKELSQKIKNQYTQNDFDIYFRGQSDNWPLLPQILRKNIDSNYQKNFEDIYKDISLEYEDIKYFAKDQNANSQERINNISKLQHHGIPTFLLDISKDEFVSMMFLFDNKTDNQKKLTDVPTPTFDIFIIPKKHPIFYRPEITVTNLRQYSQSGAFFNFDTIQDKNYTAYKIINFRFLLDVDFEIPPVPLRPSFDDTASNLYVDQLLNQVPLRPSFDDTASTILYEKPSGENVQKATRDEMFKKYLNAKSIRRGLLRKKKIMFDEIKSDLTNKLEEFHYTSYRIFPEIDNYIDVIKEDYGNRNSIELE